MLKPIGDNILGKIVDAPKKDRSIILVNEEADKTSNIVEVVSTGEGRNDRGVKIPVDVTAGQKVVVPVYAGTILEHEDVSYIIFKEQDIIAVVE